MSLSGEFLQPTEATSIGPPHFNLSHTRPAGYTTPATAIVIGLTACKPCHFNFPTYQFAPAGSTLLTGWASPYAMSDSLPGSRPLPASRYDLTTYWGRVRHSADIADMR
jgi:hypothetical protein